MPHLTLEYTNNLGAIDPDRILLALNQALLASGHFEEIDIKSRAIALDRWLVGVSGGEHAFVHVRLAILSGRSAQVKSELSSALLPVLRAAFEDIATPPLQLCVEVQDIDRASYSKDMLNAVPKP